MRDEWRVGIHPGCIRAPDCQNEIFGRGVGEFVRVRPVSANPRGGARVLGVDADRCEAEGKELRRVGRGENLRDGIADGVGDRGGSYRGWGWSWRGFWSGSWLSGRSGCSDDGRGGGLSRRVDLGGGSWITPGLAGAVGVINGLPDGKRGPVDAVDDVFLLKVTVRIRVRSSAFSSLGHVDGLNGILTLRASLRRPSSRERADEHVELDQPQPGK